MQIQQMPPVNAQKATVPDRNKLIQDIRRTLAEFPDGIPAPTLPDKFLAVTGSELKPRRYGFRTLNDLLVDLHKTVLRTPNGILYDRRIEEKKSRDEGNILKRMSEVVDLPDSVPHTKLTVDSDKVVCSSGRGHWLSNFHRSLARIDGNEYPSVEHYYQACKLYMLAGARYSAQLRRIPDPGQVKVTARRLLKGIVTDPQIDQWKIREGPRLIEYGMMHKFVQNPKLRSQLLETGDAILVHCYDRDKIFASNINKDSFQTWAKENNGKVLKIPSELSPETLPYYPQIGDGKNIAGLIAMRVRDQIRRYVESPDGAGASGLENQTGFDSVLSAIGDLSLSTTEETS